MASEAARATLILLEAGEDGFGVLAQVLRAAQGQSHPMNIQEGAPICGLTYGVYLADCGECPKDLPDGIIAPRMTRALVEPLPNTHPRPDHFPQEILDFAQGALVPESELSRRQGAGEG